MYWGIDPATNAFRLMAGAGPAAHAAQLAAYIEKLKLEVAGTPTTRGPMGVWF